jgi:hypothetical protein
VSAKPTTSVESVRRLLKQGAQTYSEFEIRQMLWDLVDDPRRPMVRARFSTQAALADAIGVSQAHLSATLTGKKPLGGRILDFLGIEQVTIYRRKVRTEAER